MIPKRDCLLQRPNSQGPTILVVEDEYLIADDMREWLKSEGFVVLGPARDLDRAMTLVRTCRPSAVLVDINLGAGRDFRFADWLSQLGVPFVFSTGYCAHVIPPKLQQVPRLEKPFARENLVRILRHVICASNGTSVGATGQFCDC